MLLLTFFGQTVSPSSINGAHLLRSCCCSPSPVKLLSPSSVAFEPPHPQAETMRGARGQKRRAGRGHRRTTTQGKGREGKGREGKARKGKREGKGKERKGKGEARPYEAPRSTSCFAFPRRLKPHRPGATAFGGRWRPHAASALHPAGAATLAASCEDATALVANPFQKAELVLHCHVL